jgi:hypothetical protein
VCYAPRTIRIIDTTCSVSLLFSATRSFLLAPAPPLSVPTLLIVCGKRAPQLPRYSRCEDMFKLCGRRYAQQEHTHSRRPRPAGAARPALMGRAAHSSRPRPWPASKSPPAHALAWAALWNSSCASCLSAAASHPGSAC